MCVAAVRVDPKKQASAFKIRPVTIPEFVTK
jgi:hypothetical protein